MKNQMCRKQITVKNWQNLTISYPKPDPHNINAHTKWWKIHWTHSLSSGNENMYIWQMDGHKDDQHETKIPCHYRVAGYKK